MTQKEIKEKVGNYIKSVLKLEGVPIKSLVEKINNIENTEYTTNNLQGKLSRGTISYSEVIQIADIIGYKIEWVKK